MKGNTKYIVVLAGTMVLFIAIQLFSPKPISWEPTFSHRDKNPFGSFVLNDQLNELFVDQPITNNNLTLYEFTDSSALPVNFVAMAETMNLDREDVKTLLGHVSEGSYALLCADFFSGALADTLKLTLRPVLDVKPGAILEDSSYLSFAQRDYERHPYRLRDMFSGFAKLDSIPAHVLVASRNAFGQPTLLRIPWGKGELLLSSTPRAFTNNYILYHNDDYVEKALSYLPNRPVWWTEYYQLGRMESGSPLRVILRDPALSWAYYLTAASLLLFIFFEAKRKQRIIPIIKPPVNATLEFVRTIGNMYIQAGNHKSIAEKKITYFFEHLRAQYYLPAEHSEQFAEVLAKKTGNTQAEAQALLALIRVIQGASSISADMLMDLNRKLDGFLGRVRPAEPSESKTIRIK